MHKILLFEKLCMRYILKCNDYIPPEYASTEQVRIGIIHYWTNEKMSKICGLIIPIIASYILGPTVMAVENKSTRYMALMMALDGEYWENKSIISTKLESIQ